MATDRGTLIFEIRLLHYIRNDRLGAADSDQPHLLDE